MIRNHGPELGVTAGVALRQLRLGPRAPFDLGERTVGKDFPHRLIMGGTQDIEICLEGQWKRAGWRCVFRWSSLPNHGVEVRSQEFGKHWREHLRIGIEWLAPCLGMRPCTGVSPAGGFTGFSCVAHSSGVKHTLD